MMPIDSKLLEKYNGSGPRYTSYPTALEFDPNFSPSKYLDALQATEGKTLSLYIHIPFCRNICYYCACNKIITKDSSKADTYIEYLLKEAELIATALNSKQVGQIHFGGGSPTFLSQTQLTTVMNHLSQLFDLNADAEIAIEIDPRTVNAEDIIFYRSIGFNRLSIGVQDLNPQVQVAVNRQHSFDEVAALVRTAKAQQFQSLNIDLITGLPRQTKESVAKTISQIIQLAPDRIAIYNYAHLPHRFKPQRRIHSNELPSAEQKMAIFDLAKNQLIEAGYVYIGMDHFAREKDSLTIAQQRGQLNRNFQGYTTHKDYQLVGLGVSSISKVGDCYSQNLVELNDYYQALDQVPIENTITENAQASLPIWRGYHLDFDDNVRQAVIMSLIANFTLDKTAIEQQFSIDFDRYFESELIQLAGFADDGLIELSPEQILVTPVGRFFIRTICMQFDRYLQELSQLQAYSKVI
ncbi:oxygen-independent coproporphyrinogen III oxidase [Kangiella sp. TOML190]|uniref:oxygen-independent coproporphyrinogen III oxidase n=1 Tax=Kangiella sp. TOML190 TaxID=2931351 RepID=UPI00203F4562|nr:oxygen-independent coproporphyrinogen III oxidase [Kangiella sp. TOML190]